MSTWNLLEIVEAVNGKLLNPPAAETMVTGVYHDTRKIEKNSLFVPVIARRDGHDFVEVAAEQGAAAAFWSKGVEDAPTNLPLILVSDTKKALQQFAKWHLKQVQPKVIGITGSNGKTTTKDMTAAVLATKYKTHKTAGNFNNELGVPLTILDMPADTEVLVLEMGMSTPGEIEPLSQLANPDVAAVTMIGESHMEAFGSREKLAAEKTSIIAGLKEEGLFIYPENEALIPKLLPSDLRIKTFGNSSQASITSSDIIEETESTHFTVQLISGEEASLSIPVPGSYNVQNALLAILIGLEFDVSLHKAKIGLEYLELTKNRLEWLDGQNGSRLLNDAYNASPTSVKAVLNYFTKIETDSKKIVVLGDILELGDLSQKLHEDLAFAISLKDYKRVYLYGDKMKYLYDRIKKQDTSGNLEHFTGEKDALIKTLKENVTQGDLVLFKSSNGTDLLSVVDELKA